MSYPGEGEQAVSAGNPQDQLVEGVQPAEDMNDAGLPWGAKWRSSAWYITLVVTLGTTTDILTYAIVVPVLPYRLQDMGYSNVSTLTAWLLFAYSMGILICTFPVAYFFHKYPYRRVPMIVGVLLLEVALIVFMLVTPFWAMVLCRFLQGSASTVVWSVGFALICENVEGKHVGRQIGFAMSGVSIGQTIAPPIGGALYSKLGWHAPFIFCIIICFVDLILRLFVLERSELRKRDEQRLSVIAGSRRSLASSEEGRQEAETAAAIVSNQDHFTTAEKEKMSGVELSPWQVIVALGSSTRGMTSFMMMICYGTVLGAFEPSLTLRVQEVWNKTSDFVGLVYLAAAAPTFFAGPIVGALADRYGAECIMLPSVILALPWVPLLTLDKSLPGFIVLFALTQLFPSCAMASTGLEVTTVARKVKGISEIHQFASMNVAFAISTAVGTIIGGQMYDHLTQGWAAVCWFCFGILAAIMPLLFFFVGNRPFYSRIFHNGQNSQSLELDAAPEQVSDLERAGRSDVSGLSLSSSRTKTNVS